MRDPCASSPPIAPSPPADGEDLVRGRPSRWSTTRRGIDLTQRRSQRQVRRSPLVPNPILNDKQFEEARSGWAAPQSPSPGGTVWPAPGQPAGPTGTAVSDGPVSPWRPGMMTVRGSITATAVLFVLLLASAV